MRSMRQNDSPSLWPRFAGFWLGTWRNLLRGIEEENTWRDYWKTALRVDVSFRLLGWGLRRQPPCPASSRPAPHLLTRPRPAPLTRRLSPSTGPRTPRP